MGRGEPINIIIRADLTMCNVQTNQGPQLDAQVKVPQYGSTPNRIIGAEIKV